MELELHELEFYASFLFLFYFIYFIIIFLSKFDRPIFDFLQIEFYIETRFWENRVSK